MPYAFTQDVTIDEAIYVPPEPARTAMDLVHLRLP